MYLANLNWQEAEKLFKREDLVALIPLGSTEQHGPIGPLGTDFFVPDYLAKCVEKRTEVLVAPTMPYGVATHHTSFPGTIDIGMDGLYLVMQGITNSLSKHGVKRFIFLNGHGGNDPVLERVALELNRMGGLGAIIDWWSLAPALNSDWRGGHGDGQEVAMMLAIDETLVKREYLIETKVEHLSKNLINTHLNQVQFQGGSVKIIRDVRSVVNSGGYGGSDSAKATKEWGEAMAARITDYIVDFIEEFKTVERKSAK